MLRGPRPKAGTAGLEQALKTFRAERDTLHRSDPRRFLNEAQLEAAATLIGQLKLALAPLEELAKGAQPFATIAERHQQVLMALGGVTEELAPAFDEIVETFGLGQIDLAVLERTPGKLSRLRGSHIVDRRQRCE